MLIGALLRAVLAREAWTSFPARCFWIGRVMPGVSYRRYAPCGPSALRGRISITSSTLLMSPVSTFRRACGTISYSVMGSTARISSTPDVTPPLQRLTRLPSLSHPLPLVFGAHPILNSGCSVSCIAFCLPRVPSLLESLHFALGVPPPAPCKGSTLHFSTCLFSICDSEFPIAMRKITGKKKQISERPVV